MEVFEQTKNTKDVREDPECSGTNILREKNRQLRQETCRLKREAILRNKRIRLNEEELRFREISVEEVKKLAFDLKKGKTDVTTLRTIKRAAAESEEHIQAFLRVNGALYALVGFLTGADSEKQVEAAGCITNLATGTHKCTYKILKSTGAYLITYLYGCNPFMQSQCAWALGNMIADCSKCCEHLKCQGLVPAIVKLLQSPYAAVIQSVVFALRNYTAWEEEDCVDLISQDFITSLFSLFSREDLKPAVQADIAHVLFNLTIRSQTLNAYLKKEDLEKVMDLLVSCCSDLENNIIVITPLVRCFGNLTSGEDLSILEMLSTPSFGFCVKLLLSSQHHHLQKEVLWVLSNVLVNRNASILAILDLPSLLESLLPLLSMLDSAVMQALYFLCVLVSQHESSCQYIINSGLLVNLKILQQCERDDIAQATNVLLSLLNST